MSGLRSSRNLSAPPTLIRAGNLECPIRFWNLGVKPDPMVPHTWGFGASPTIPQGGSCSNIYKDLSVESALYEGQLTVMHDFDKSYYLFLLFSCAF